MIPKNMYINLSMLSKNHTGLGVYSEHCAANIEKNFFCTIVTSVYKSMFNSHIIESPSSITFATSKSASILRILYLTFCFPKEADFIYSPTHHGIWNKKNQIITIHDLTPIHHLKQHKFQYLYFKYFLPHIINQSKAIFTVSETAKNDICNFYKLDYKKVYVIPNGVDTTLFYPGNLNDRKDRYLLVVGASYPHKNIHEILNNYKLWKGKYKLKIASSRGKYYLFLKKMIEQLNLVDDVEFLGYVSNEQLVDLYRNCTALIFPSLWEGFGIPPLEALACGRPAIVSDIDVHKEIFGDAAIFITPGNQESWQNAFNVLEDKSQVKRIVELGQKKVNYYTWEHSSTILINALLDVEPEIKKFIKKCE